MKFQIRKTSGTSCYEESEPTDNPPCDNATYEKFIYQHRQLNEPEKDWWYSRGENHRIEYGCFVRDLIWYGWFIEINTLEELVGLQKQLGIELILKDGEIEIYDDYRE